MSSRHALLAAAVAVLAAAVVPWPDSPFRRLAGGEGDGRDPTFDVRLDPRALREEGERLPAGLRYYLDAAGTSPLVQGNAKAAGQLYLARQLPVQNPRRAEARFGYRNGRVVPLPGG